MTGICECSPYIKIEPFPKLMDIQEELKIFLLGSPRLIWNDKPLMVSRRQVRALLYRLAASLSPVTREELYALLWPKKSDTAARRNLSRLNAYLRQEMPDPELVQVTPETVSLDVERVWCDLPALLGVNNNDLDDVLESVVSLISGRFLEGFYLPDNLLYEDWLLETQRIVEQKYQDILDELVTRKSTARDYASAIQYARQALVADSLNEEKHRQLIDLYALTGDRRAAQRQYEQCVIILERELGVAPLPETRSAYETALQARQSPPITYPSPRWAILPSLDLPLTGRESAMEQLKQAQRRLQSGGIIWISGEAGIGKSRLMQEFARQSQALVLAGSAYSNTQVIPYSPIINALRPILEHLEWLAQVPEIWLSEAQVLLPDLRTAFSHLPQPLPLEPSQVQSRHFESLAQIFLGISKQTQLLLCLDDLHWADEDSLAWLRYFINRLPGSKLIVVVTSRPSESQRTISTLTQMRRSGFLAEITLEALDQDAVDELLHSLPGSIQSSELGQRLQRASGGNPFFLLEILRALLERGEIEQSPDSLPLPPSVREVIASRLDLVSPLAIQLLEAAVILETNLQPAILQSVSGRQEHESADGLTELVEHQLIRVEGKLLFFQHDLIRMTVLDRLQFWRQQMLHRRAAEALSSDVTTHPALIAYHWGRAEEWVEAVKAYSKASQYFADQYAYPAAMIQVECGLTVLENIPGSKLLRLNLLILRMQLNQVLLEMDEWQADLVAVDELAAELGNSDAQLQILESKLSLFTLQSDLPSLETTAEQALALAQKNKNLRAEAGIRNIWGWHLSDVAGRPFEGLAHLELAVDLSREIDDTILLYRCLCNLAFCQRALGCCGDALSLARQALDLTTFSEEPHPVQADALREIAEAAGYLARWQEARAAMQQVVKLYEKIGDPWALGTALYNLGLFTSAMGQHTEAITAMERLVQLGVDIGLPPDSEYGIIHRTGLAKARLDSGDVSGATEVYQVVSLSGSITGRARIDYANVGGGIALAKGDAVTAMRILDPVVAELLTSQAAHFMWTLLLHAQAAQHIGDTQNALNSLERVEKQFQQGDCIRLLRYLLFTRYQISGDQKSLSATYEELQRQADMFTDQDLRADFLDKVIINREIKAAWGQKPVS